MTESVLEYSEVSEKTEISDRGRGKRVLCGIRTAIWEMWAEFRHEWKRITLASVISPLLYMLALGWGLGSMVNTSGRPYIDFLVPGIVALSTMNTGFTSVGMSFSTQRLYEKSFDQVLISPTPIPSYLFGKMIGGALRGMYTGTLIILLSIPFGAHLEFNGWFFFVMMLNGMVFASLGVLAAILAVTHADISRFSAFVITPMTFLCNTMFPVEKMPEVLKWIINVLPLTHTSSLLRKIAYGGAPDVISIIILSAFAAGFIIITYCVLVKRRNL